MPFSGTIRKFVYVFFVFLTEIQEQVLDESRIISGIYFRIVSFIHFKPIDPLFGRIGIPLQAIAPNTTSTNPCGSQENVNVRNENL